jgi:hypothetical protein
MVNFGESSMDFWKECILCCCWMKYSETSVRSILSMVSFRSRIALSFFCLGDLYIGDRVVKSPLPHRPWCWGLYVLLNPLVYVWGSWVHWHWVHIGWQLLFPFDVLPLLLVWSDLCLIWPCKFEAYFVWYTHCYSCLFLGWMWWLTW